MYKFKLSRMIVIAFLLILSANSLFLNINDLNTGYRFGIDGIATVVYAAPPYIEFSDTKIRTQSLPLDQMPDFIQKVSEGTYRMYVSRQHLVRKTDFDENQTFRLLFAHPHQTNIIVQMRFLQDVHRKEILHMILENTAPVSYDM